MILIVTKKGVTIQMERHKLYSFWLVALTMVVWIVSPEYIEQNNDNFN